MIIRRTLFDTSLNSSPDDDVELRDAEFGNGAKSIRFGFFSLVAIDRGISLTCRRKSSHGPFQSSLINRPFLHPISPAILPLVLIEERTIR